MTAGIPVATVTTTILKAYIPAGLVSQLLQLAIGVEYLCVGFENTLSRVDSADVSSYSRSFYQIVKTVVQLSKAFGSFESTHKRHGLLSLPTTDMVLLLLAHGFKATLSFSLSVLIFFLPSTHSTYLEVDKIQAGIHDSSDTFVQTPDIVCAPQTA
ncbi:hypothetical protein HG531_000938 [Fusarium graminearum]|nr:hypothetical protein HG531_000938 [Fusarium graminearum]